MMFTFLLLVLSTYYLLVVWQTSPLPFIAYIKARMQAHGPLLSTLSECNKCLSFWITLMLLTVCILPTIFITNWVLIYLLHIFAVCGIITLGDFVYGKFIK